MDLWTLTFERVESLKQELEAKARKLEALEASSVEQLWEHDLKSLSDLLDKLDNQEAAQEAAVRPKIATWCQGRKAASPMRPSSHGGGVHTYKVGDKVEYW